MKPQVVLNIVLTPDQTERLIHLQQMFAQACNHLSPIVQQTRCWNRVALHHMAYRGLRERFPALGSQMVCNAIYSVSRTCRALFQNPESPYSLQKLGSAALPQVLFLPQSPVYFDRHTLSLKNGRASMYTLDGRIKFNVELSDEQASHFRSSRLREIVMSAESTRLMLSFSFDDPALATTSDTDDDMRSPDMPEYVVVTDTPALPAVLPSASLIPTKEALQ